MEILDCRLTYQTPEIRVLLTDMDIITTSGVGQGTDNDWGLGPLPG